jgi:hypothetical protein
VSHVLYNFFIFPVLSVFMFYLFRLLSQPHPLLSIHSRNGTDCFSGNTVDSYSREACFEYRLVYRLFDSCVPRFFILLGYCRDGGSNGLQLLQSNSVSFSHAFPILALEATE